MQLKLKTLHQDAVPAALERAQRYRLLNEPEQAESICRDVLRADPENQPALISLLLALTDQFAHGLAQRVRQAKELAGRLQGEYEQAYYSGVICERRARSQLKQGVPEFVVYEWLQEAMECYEKAEKLRPQGDDNALLRWNSCARTIRDLNLEPSGEEAVQHFLE
ncbi:MAG: hypothetical protein V3T83_10855 [Acidobacteriota bacterium]